MRRPASWIEGKMEMEPFEMLQTLMIYKNLYILKDAITKEAWGKREGEKNATSACDVMREKNGVKERLKRSKPECDGFAHVFAFLSSLAHSSVSLRVP